MPSSEVLNAYAMPDDCVKCQENVVTMQDDDKRKDDDKKKDSLCKLDCLRKGLGHLCSSLRSWRLYTQREFRQ